MGFMYRISGLMALLIFHTAGLYAQVKLPVYADSLFSTYYHQRVTHFRSLPAGPRDILLAGNSITDGAEWGELFRDSRIKNRGISGDHSAGLLNRLDELVRGRPAKIFIAIGTNDLARGISPDSVLNNILLAVDYIRQESPVTQIWVQSLFPVNNRFEKFSGHTGNGEKIRYLNERLEKWALQRGYQFLDVYNTLKDADGKLDARFTNDGLHLSGEGYLRWRYLLYPYVMGVEEKPSLIPKPRELAWGTDYFDLTKAHLYLPVNHPFEKAASLLVNELKKAGIQLPVSDSILPGKPVIQLIKEHIQEPRHGEEAYRLEANTHAVKLMAGSPKGMFYAVQTFLQLARDGYSLPACRITDWPAFSWRGYMIDAGRNYVSVELLKEQIDVMSRYKMNVFHFHATEDVAWRLESRKYPQLHMPENMLRDKGEYYTVEEIKDLIRYCREREILFVPEIDMPGHSAAFRRAMGTDMQSDTGLVRVKELLKEFCDTYDLPYVHIGADEVKITNPEFIPEVTRYLRSRGREVIGWQPGGNFDSTTIRQLWMDDGGKITGSGKIAYIDSRHLYLNHMDPLEAVVTIFNRRIGNKDYGDGQALGGTICLWHDRALSTESDLLRMNPLYPSILAFAERSWQGGGTEKWVANISDGDEKGFARFERALLEHKSRYFTGKHFPYWQQAGLRWKLLGPYKNEGNLQNTFPPEQQSPFRLQSVKEMTGGTVVLRHWWDPLIRAGIPEPRPNSTWYAVTRIRMETDTVIGCWVDFNNLSRSPATDSPPEGYWDEKFSALWVNGQLIAPPQWKRAGQKGHPEIPLVDEGYAYRPPLQIHFKKGWNTILVKCPVGSFKGRDWQNPVKWMFTFLPLVDFTAE